jgi:hypothetical protein
MTLSALIALLEESKEGSRELDIAIAKAMYPETTYDAAEDKWYLHGFHVRIEQYTRSLDSALTLLAKGTLWAAVCMEDGPLARLCWPQKDGGYGGGYFEASAHTVPLALVIAALKARGG